MPTPIHIQDAQARDNGARVEDQRILDQRLIGVAKSRRELTKVLDDTIGTIGYIYWLMGLIF